MPDLGVEFSEVALGNAGVLPIDAVGMRQRDAADFCLRIVCQRAVFGRRLARRPHPGLDLAHDLLSRFVLAQPWNEAACDVWTLGPLAGSAACREPF